MDSKTFLRRIHICGTLWFLLCAAVLLILSMHQAGLKWWLIFSISGYSAVLLLFLFTIYLFAIFQGVVRNLNSTEHPLSTSIYYIALYDLAPFVGAIAGLFAITSYGSWIAVLNSIVQGALAMTFLVWIVIDPPLGLVETWLPAGIAHRKQRLTEVKNQKQKQQKDNQQLLQNLEGKELQQMAEWQHSFTPYAKEAADLLSDSPSSIQTQRRVIELGALAWQTGKLIGMEFLHKQIQDELRNRACSVSVDYVSFWWDGVGNWRRPALQLKAF
jgi:hypothetical protein